MDEFMAIFLMLISIAVAGFLATQIRSFKEIIVAFSLICVAIHINTYLY